MIPGASSWAFAQDHPVIHRVIAALNRSYTNPSRSKFRVSDPPRMNKIPILLIAWILISIFAPDTAPAQTRGIWVWGRNIRDYWFTDDYGTNIYVGNAQVRIFQSHAPDYVPFEPNWEHGVVFEEMASQGPVSQEFYAASYRSTTWFSHTMHPDGVALWLQSHFCEWAVPSVWSDREDVFQIPKSAITDGSPYYYHMDKQTSPFSGSYYFY